MMKKILIVCTANICRSPLAEAILQSMLPGSLVSSAGLNATEGKAMDPVIEGAMKEFNIDVPEHRARRASLKMFEASDLILVMESQHKRAIEHMYPTGRGKVFCLDPAADIPDPHLKTISAYMAVAHRISAQCNYWAQRINSL